MSIVDRMTSVVRGRFVRNVAVVAGGTAIARAISMVFSPVITRLYGPETFGILAVFMALVGIVAPFATLTYANAIVLPESDAAARSIAAIALGIAAFLSLILLGILFLFGESVTSAIGLDLSRGYSLLFPAVVLLTAVQYVLTQRLMRLERFKLISSAGVAQAGILGISKSLAGIVAPSAPALVTLNALGQAVHCWLSYVAIDHGGRRGGAKPRNRIGEVVASMRRVAHEYRDSPFFRSPQVLLHSVSEGPGRVVSATVVNLSVVSPKPLRNAVLGLAVGLVFGLGMAFLYEYLDNTIKSTEEAEKIFGAPVLGTVPLDFMNFQHDMKAILLTSAAPGEGKSTVAANLAAALAQAGKKVVLVSVDFRRPTTEQFFNVNNMIGLSDVLIGTHSLKAALQRPGDEQLLVLTADKMPPNPSELPGSTKMQEVIRSLEEWGDWVIIDTPPLLAVADAAAVARWADGVLMVTQAAVSTREACKKALALLNQVGAKIAGVVVWGLDESRSGGTGYGYSSGYCYASYYSTTPSTGRRGGRQDNGAQAAGVGTDVAAQHGVPKESGGRKFARVLGKVLIGVLAFFVILLIAAAVACFLDQAMWWGIVPRIVGDAL